MDAGGDTRTHPTPHASGRDAGGPCAEPWSPRPSALFGAAAELGGSGVPKAAAKGTCQERSKNIYHSCSIDRVSFAVMVDLGGWK